MASAFLRRQNLGICQNFLSSSAPNRFIYSKNNHCWQQNGPYSRWSSFFRRDAKAVDMPATPFVFGSSSSSSSSSSSFSAFGFVGWYLGMVKSRPIVTKSVTCSLIYIAADLTSQVGDLIYPSKPFTFCALWFLDCVCEAFWAWVITSMDCCDYVIRNLRYLALLLTLRLLPGDG